MMAPMVDELAEGDGGVCTGGKTQCRRRPGHGGAVLRSIPTLLALKKGLKVDRIVGVQSKSDIARRLQQGIA
jgi:thioredoxin-like negative regulator of GroEL